MLKLKFIFIFCLYINLLLAQTDKEYPVIELDSQSEMSIKGNLNNGSIMPLEWATNSSVACFPSTRFNEFRGNHILYRITLPAASEIDITVTPTNKKDRINVYALRFGEDNLSAPPEVSSAISCEAGYTIYTGQPNYKIANKPKSVSLMSIQKSYTIVIGVAGAIDTMEGDYELGIKIKKR